MPDEVIEEEEVEQEPEQSGVEAEARSMGWVPLEEFRGPKDQWRDADEFVERGKNVLPIVNSLLKKERDKTSKLETKLEKLNADWGEKLKRLESMSELAIKKTEERIRREYEEKKEAAVERGDMEAYRAAEKGEKAALKDLEEKVEAKEAKKDTRRDDLPESVKKTLDEWVAENPWFQKDAKLNALANAIHVELLDEQPGLTIAENLAKVREMVAEKFPEKFGLDDKPRRVSRVEGGSRSGGGVGATLYSKLPSEAKAIADKQIALYLQPGETAEKDGQKAKERWAKVYWDQPGV